MPKRPIYLHCITMCIEMLLSEHGELMKLFIEKECAQMCKCSDSTVRKYLEKLVNDGLITKIKRGRVVYFRLANKNKQR